MSDFSAVAETTYETCNIVCADDLSVDIAVLDDDVRTGCTDETTDIVSIAGSVVLTCYETFSIVVTGAIAAAAV